MSAPSTLRPQVVPYGTSVASMRPPRGCGAIIGRLSGDWTVEKQAAVLHKANGRIAYRFHARDLHLVMGPAARGTVRAISRAPRWTAAGRCARH